MPAGGCAWASEERWHCVWAALEEFDDAGQCTFKSFNDVYLERLGRPPSKSEHHRANGPPYQTR